MSITETVLLVLGILIFIVSFFVPAGGKKQQQKEPDGIREDEIKELIDKEVDEARTKIRDIVEETVTYSMEKTERAMDRITNEKMMAVSEYSDTVLEQISKNHKETVFLYDMLNDKHENLKQSVSEAAKADVWLKQTVKDARESTQEVREKEDRGRTIRVEEGIQTSAADRKEEEPVAEPKPVPVQEMPETEAADFTPIQAKKVEVLSETEDAEKPKRKTGKKPAQEAAGTGKAAPERKEQRAVLSMADAEGKSNKEKILALHEAGKSNIAIAKELGLGIGEVKLVIDLFKGI